MPIELPSTPTNLGGIIAPSGLTIPSPLKTIPSVASEPVLFDSLVFDGTSMLSNTEYHPEISGTGQQYTIALLVKVNDVSNLQCIASFGKTTSHSYRTVGIDPNGGDPRFFGGSGATYRRLGSTSVIPEVGKWYGITLTMQAAGNGQYLQVNGITLNSTASDGNLTNARSDSTNGICTLGGRYGNNDLFTGEVGMFLIVDNPHYFSSHLKWLQNSPYSLLPAAAKTDTVINLLDQDRIWNASIIIDSVNSHPFSITSGVSYSNDTIANGGYLGGFVNDGSWEGDGVADYLDFTYAYNPTTEIGTGDFSVVLRFKSDDVTATQYFLRWGEDSVSSNGFLQFNIQSSKLRVHFKEAGSGNVDSFEFSPTLVNDTWYSVILSRTGTTFDAWLNGANAIDETSTNLGTGAGAEIDTNFNADKHILGRARTTLSALFLNGHLCQYAIFNGRVLTADEAEVIHGGGVPHDLTTDRTYNSKTYTADPATLDLYALLNTGIENGNLSRTGLLVNRGSSTNLIGVNIGGTWSADVPSFNQICLDFDGVDDYMSVPDSNDLSFGNGSIDSAFSIVAWVKMDDATSFPICEKVVNTDTREYILHVNGSDKLQFILYDAADEDRIFVTSDSAITANEGAWTLLVATYDGGGSTSGITLYVNDSAVAATGGSAGSYASMNNTSGALNIATFTAAAAFADGKIDEVAIIPSELSAAQVSSIYNSGEPADLTPYSPSGWWRFEEGTGTSIADSSGNGHTATLTNGPTFSTDIPS